LAPVQLLHETVSKHDWNQNWQGHRMPSLGYCLLGWVPVAAKAWALDFLLLKQRKTGK
jgi:hypothetical protein